MTLRLAALCGVTLALYPIRLLGVPLRRRAPATARAWRNAVTRLWAGVVSRVMGLHVTVEGAAPAPPFLLVANHLGYVDVFLLARCLPGVFVAKAELATWPVAGRIIASADTIFVDRGRKRDLIAVNARIARALDAGEGVILFPEGTSSGGDDVLPLMPSLLSVAAARHHPVWYATISYATPEGEAPAREAVAWWGDAEFLPHLLGLLRIPRVDARLTFGAHPVVDGDRKRLASTLHAAIAAGRAVQPESEMA